ncbi:DUF4306 domain-containing protein [Psychrobacillus glaciei]|uniref:DUF4306 domain-containing protein n=1 Tax=Psychrobacillus glaciei TaxID=2283160 RepID=A0A5J6SPY1_9BACI|nr:DUF4306 domain-containing protein [Psychrobacillus glaciei]QFG00006.1 DUF4306 domain-containing protein [Psychrobacillus glaciei]
MSFKIILQLSVACMFLVFSTLVAWYEGSEIVHTPWEWKYTAIFSEMVHGPVKQGTDILIIDYFVYAAKFASSFPLLMLLSSTYIIILLGYALLKRKGKKFPYFLSCIGVLFIVLSVLVPSSPTIGLKSFFNCFLLMGILLIVIALLKLFNIMMFQKRLL